MKKLKVQLDLNTSQLQLNATEENKFNFWSEIVKLAIRKKKLLHENINYKTIVQEKASCIIS